MPLAGLRVRLERTVDTPCVRCGGTVVVIGEGAGPHAARLRAFAAVRADAMLLPNPIGPAFSSPRQTMKRRCAIPR